MRDHYDFANMPGRRNPYVKQLKQPVTMELDRETLAYFEALADESGIACQDVIGLYLRDCALHHRKLRIEWSPE